jgi:hypothetical protein
VRSSWNTTMRATRRASDILTDLTPYGWQLEWTHKTLVVLRLLSGRTIGKIVVR